MRFALKFELPSVERLVVDLGINDDVAVGTAMSKVEDRRHALERARQRLATATRRRELLPGQVAAGMARATDLEGAITEERVAALAITQFEGDLERGLAEVAAARASALDAIEDRAARRLGELQVQADQLAPALNLLRELEDAIVRAVSRSRHDFAKVSAKMATPGARNRRPAPLPMLRWPSTIEDELNRQNGLTAAAAHARATASSMATK